jgi:flavin reductase (DIM6/NTAB) family NADH-FMN oxidoreductase RutF
MTPDGPVGLSIGSFTSVSLDPPLIGFLPARTSRSWPGIRAAGQFAVSVLQAGQESVARTFAAPHDDRFDGVTWKPAPFSGAPVLDGSAAWIDCSIEAVSAAGDHHFGLGRVLDLGVLDEDADPLVFFRGQYR